MHDALFMSSGETSGHLDSVIDRLLSRNVAAVQFRAQCGAFEQLGHDEGRAALGADVEDRDDVRVVQGGGGLRFLLEPPESLRVGREGGRKNFQCDVTLQSWVASPIHFSHAAGAEQGHDLVVGDLCSGRKCHEM